MIGKWHTGREKGQGRAWDYSAIWDHTQPRIYGAYYTGQSIDFNGGPPKKVGGSGTKDTDNLRSIPCDDVKRDEIDLMDMDMVYMSTQRLLRSKVGRQSNFGSPTFPNY